jgi:hypothetical protein
MTKEERREQFIRDVLSTDNTENISHNWSFLFHNNYLRRVLKAIFDSREDLTYRLLEKDLKIDKKNLYSYLNFNLNPNITQKLSDLKIISLAEYLGVNIDLNIHIDEKKLKKNDEN